MIDKLSKIQSLNVPNGVSEKKNSLKNEFTDSLRSFLERKGYRADLCIVGNKKQNDGSIGIDIKFNAKLNFPSDKDLMPLVASAYPGYDIDWSTAVVDEEEGTISMAINPQAVMIPVKSIKDIPEAFQPVGTAIFMKKASDNLAEIWELKRDADGDLFLMRKMDDDQVLKEEKEGIKEGDAVETPDGVGVVSGFDEIGNVFVQIGSRKRLIAADDVKKYDTKKDMSKLYEYYAQVYGPDFAKYLVSVYGDVEDTRK